MAAPMPLAVGDRVVWTDPDHPRGSPPMPMSGEVVNVDDPYFVVLYDGYRHLPPGTPARRVTFTVKDVLERRLVREDEYLARPFARRPWAGDPR